MSALGNAIEILEAVTHSGAQGLSFSEVVRQTGLPKASAHRLLRELRSLSLVSLDERSRCYRGGLKLARLGASVAAGYDLRSTVRPQLERLHRETGHVATLGIRNGTAGVYIDKIESADFGIRLHSEVGKEFPLHCTAMGKVLLSRAEEPTVQAVLAGRLTRYTPRTLTRPDDIRRELQQARADGYAMDREEITRGLVCVAAPIFDVLGELAGAISCTFPSYVVDEDGLNDAIAAVVNSASLASGMEQSD